MEETNEYTLKMLYFLQKRAIFFVRDIIDTNLINVRSLIRRYGWEKSLKINVRRTFIRHLRVAKKLQAVKVGGLKKNLPLSPS